MHLCKYSLSCVVSQPWALGLPGLGSSKLKLWPCGFEKYGTILGPYVFLAWAFLNWNHSHVILKNVAQSRAGTPKSKLKSPTWDGVK